MTTLSKAAIRPFEDGDINQLPMIANDIIYQLAAVGDNGSGYARPLVAGDPFRGFAEATADNSGGSAGDVDVRTIKRGNIQLKISGLAITDVDKPVYASDDDTFTLTQGSNSHIGRVSRWVKSGVGMVEFDVTRAGLGGAIAELTDNSGGTASDTIAAISDTATKNAVASLTAKLNQVLRQLGN